VNNEAEIRRKGHSMLSVRIEKRNAAAFTSTGQFSRNNTIFGHSEPHWFDVILHLLHKNTTHKHKKLTHMNVI
jgi:hypothetical protein